MFSLGSFSSILPFLILAITYFAGLTTYSLSFAQNRLDNKKFAEKNIKSEDSFNQETISENTFELIHNKEEFVAEYRHIYHSFAAPLNLAIFELINCSPHISNNFIGSLYMRPPPSFLFA